MLVGDGGEDRLPRSDGRIEGADQPAVIGFELSEFAEYDEVACWNLL